MSSVVLFSVLIPLLSFGVKLVGIVIAVWRWNRCPRVAKFATIGLSLMLIGQVGRGVLTFVLTAFVSASEFGQYIGLIGFLDALVKVVGWVFLFIALFGSHTTVRTENVSDPELGQSTDEGQPRETGNPYQAPA